MRLSIDSFRRHGGAFIVAAALGGCSNAQPLSLPAGSAASAARDAFDAPRYLPNGRIGPLDLLELQADGKLPGPVGRAALRRGLEIARHHGRPHLKLGKRAAPVGMWLSDTYESYLVGQSSRGNKTEAAIDAGKNGCTYPGAVKVNASQNVWTTCETDTALTGDVVQEYSNKGALEGSYAAACPLTKSPGCKYWYAYGYDGASDGQHVFAALTFWEIKTCNPSCVVTYGPGFEWWNAGSSSATPTLIALPYGSPVNYVDYVERRRFGQPLVRLLRLLEGVAVRLRTRRDRESYQLVLAVRLDSAARRDRTRGRRVRRRERRGTQRHRSRGAHGLSVCAPALSERFADKRARPDADRLFRRGDSRCRRLQCKRR